MINLASKNFFHLENVEKYPKNPRNDFFRNVFGEEFAPTSFMAEFRGIKKVTSFSETSFPHSRKNKERNRSGVNRKIQWLIWTPICCLILLRPSWTKLTLLLKCQLRWVWKWKNIFREFFNSIPFFT